MPHRSAAARAHHSRRTLRAIVIAMVCGLGPGSLFGQYIADPLLLEGDFVPGTGAVISAIGRPSINPIGTWACEGDETGSLADDFLLVAPGLLLRSGDSILGSAGIIDEIDPFETNRAINIAGLAAWTGSLSGVSVIEDEFLARGGSIAVLEGSPAPIAGRSYAGFSFPSIDDAGTIYFEADLDGATSSDEALVRIDANGTSTILPMNSASLFREGATIAGGELDGHRWDNGAFLDLRANAGGTILVEGDLETTGGGLANSFNNEVLIRKKPTEDYELLLREGASVLATPLTGAVALASIIELDLADNDDWAVRGALDIGVTSTEFNDVIIASFGGVPGEVIAQEGMDLSAALGTPGLVLGAILGVRINSDSQVLMLANVRSLLGPSPVDEALFLVGNGALTLVLADEVTVLPGSGAPLTGLTTDHLALSDSGRMIFGGTTTVQGLPRDGLFEARLPSVFPVENLICVQSSGVPAATAIWQNSSVTPYDGLQIWVDGTLAATIDGAETSFETPLLATVDRTVTIEVEPFVGAELASREECSTFVVRPPDAILCAGGGPLVPDLATVSSTIVSPLSSSVREARVTVEVAHSSAGDLRLNLSAPNGTSLQLLTPQGSGGSDLRATFHDLGRPASLSVLELGETLAPSGPGMLSDLRCESATGSWTLTISDESPGGLGSLVDWCLEFVDETDVAANCCPLPSEFRATSGGPCLPGAVFSWQNNAAVSELSIRRIDPLGSITETMLSPSDTSWNDPSALSGETYEYELWIRCTASGLERRADSATLTIDNATVPGVGDVTALSDPCNGIVELTWTDFGLPFDSVSLLRDGVLLADVTGLSSFVDTSPPAGVVNYRWITACGVETGEREVSLSTDLLPPQNRACETVRSDCDGIVELTWINPHTYDALDIVIDGTLPIVVTPAQTSASTPSLSAGWHTIEWTATCGGVTVTSECSVLVSAPPSFSSDAILALEGSELGSDPGATNSALALARALESHGIVADVLAPTPGADLITGIPCGASLSDYSRLWVIGGTFPNDRRLSVAESEALADLNREFGVALYFESGDHWGFQSVPSALDLRDGVAAGTPDGDDTLTAMIAHPTTAVGAVFPLPVSYSPENIGSDYNDQLTAAGSVGTLADSDVAGVQQLWANSPDGLPDPTNPAESLPYGVTLAVVPTVGAPLVVQSWEFGGFDLDRNAPTGSDAARSLWAGLLLDHLSGIPTVTFYRGDANDDGDVNIADAIFMLGSLFPPPGSTPAVIGCQAAADLNADGGVNIADAIALLETLFLPNAPALPAPNLATGCGVDSSTNLSCQQFAACP